ncbi:MAG: methyltransferase domain-containing protein [Clostridiales bacterium]|nr:methyltransferase domain-containing protein [Clostridiales bacterium]
MINIRIAEYRKKYKMTQVELAQQLGISFQSISKWETGVAYPDIVMLTKLSDFFNVSLDEFVGRMKKNSGDAGKDNPTFWGKKLDYLQETRKDLWNDDYFEFLVMKVWNFVEPIDIVDYGCGYGYLGLKLLPLLPEGSTYTGIDSSLELIEEARNIFNNSSFETNFIKCDIYEFEPESVYDVAICQAIIRHSNYPEKILEKMVGSTKTGGKVICIEIDRLTEEIGYFNSMMDYEPFVHLRVYEKLWKNETKNMGRDYSVGIKIPSMLNKLGLVNIEARVNDKVLISNEKNGINSLMETREWNKKELESSVSKVKIRLVENDVDSDDVDAYISWYKENVKTLENITHTDMVTFFRGLIISYGDKT